MRRQHGQKLEIIPNTFETCGEVIERSLAVAKYQKLVEPFKIGNVAVSYTHLDVYKRQGSKERQPLSGRRARLGGGLFMC